MQANDRVRHIHTSQLGTVAGTPYRNEFDGLVADVRWDTGDASTVLVAHIREA